MFIIKAQMIVSIHDLKAQCDFQDLQKIADEVCVILKLLFTTSGAAIIYILFYKDDHLVNCISFYEMISKKISKENHSDFFSIDSKSTGVITTLNKTPFSPHRLEIFLSVYFRICFKHIKGLYYMGNFTSNVFRTFWLKIRL